MKKTVSLLMAALLVCTVILGLPGFVLKAHAAIIIDPSTGLKFNSTTYAIVGYSGSPTALTIPSRIDDSTVKEIGANAFKNCTSLTSVTMPRDLRYVRASAFQGCSQLTSVKLGDLTMFIESYAFSGCSKLASINKPPMIKPFGDYAFQGCSSLTSIEIPGSTSTIGVGLFKDCAQLNNVVIPDGVTSIGASSFQNCTSLTSITIPENINLTYKVTSIGASSFQNCTSLKKITIPSSVTSIGASAFDGTAGLKIWGYAGSYAQTYAHSNSIEFADLLNGITVTLSKTSTNFVVNIKDFVVNQKYQIWSYQKVTSDLFLDDTSAVSANQWVLSRAYVLSSEADRVETDGSVSFYIDNFTSPAINYTIDVRVIDENSNYINNCMETYTPAEIQEVKINKVLVDGKFSNGQESKEIKTNKSVTFSVIGNGVAGTSYSATILQDGRSLATASASNIFSWNTSSEKQGKYTVKLTASNGTSSDEKIITVNLFNQVAYINQGLINAVNVAGEKAADKFNIMMNLTIPSGHGEQFYYTVGEPNYSPIVSSGMLTLGSSFAQPLAAENYGFYMVYGYVKRTAYNDYDDGFARTVENKRSGNHSIKLTSNIDTAGTMSTINTLKGSKVSFSAKAVLGTLGQESIKYSYWRNDAKGYSLVKGWSSSSDFNWTPARVGQYTIQVRAKGPGALSYEIAKSITVNVTDANETIAQNVVITTNSTELNANAITRTMLTIKANATATNGTDLLYKFCVSDDFLGTTQIQDYSTNQSCTWVPRKEGTYTVSVLVKNEASFGKYDAMQSFTVIVKDKTNIIE